jgi:proline dehydrogenase
MAAERQRAAALGRACVIHASLADTHACYDACAEQLARASLAGSAEFMAATHNEASVLRIVRLLERERERAGGGGASGASGSWRSCPT